MRRTVAVYEERLIEGHAPLESVNPPGSHMQILSATKVGPDVLFKYVVVWGEDDDAPT